MIAAIIVLGTLSLASGFYFLGYFTARAEERRKIYRAGYGRYTCCRETGCPVFYYGPAK